MTFELFARIVLRALLALLYYHSAQHGTGDAQIKVQASIREIEENI